MNYSTDFSSLKKKVPEEEWQTRLELAACYRLVDKYGMTGFEPARGQPRQPVGDSR